MKIIDFLFGKKKSENDQTIPSGQSLAWYREKAEQGDKNAQYQLAKMFDDGIQCAINKSKALFWYQKAAEQGHSNAQNNLGTLLSKGWKDEGITQDKTTAHKWYRLAAEQGNRFAEFNLANMLDQGQGVSQNQEEAIEWYKKAAAHGFKTVFSEKDDKVVNAYLNTVAKYKLFIHKEVNEYDMYVKEVLEKVSYNNLNRAIVEACNVYVSSSENKEIINSIPVLAILLSKGANINYIFGDETSLCLAIGNHNRPQRNNIPIVDFLLQMGANPNLGSKRGETPLIKAVERQSIEMIDLLLSYNAIINLPDFNGKTPLHMAKWRKNNELIQKIEKLGGVEDIEKIKNANYVIEAIDKRTSRPSYLHFKKVYSEGTWSELVEKTADGTKMPMEVAELLSNNKNKASYSDSPYTYKATEWTSSSF